MPDIEWTIILVRKSRVPKDEPLLTIERKLTHRTDDQEQDRALGAIEVEIPSMVRAIYHRRDRS